MKSPEAPPGLSERSLRLWSALQGEYEFSPSDQATLRRSLESYDLADDLLARAHVAGLSTKEGKGLLAAARDASLVGLRHWAHLQFGKADQGAPRRPGRQPGDEWSQQRRQAREHLTGKPLGGGLA
jgi:hypothetical protein